MSDIKTIFAHFAHILTPAAGFPMLTDITGDYTEMLYRLNTAGRGNIIQKYAGKSMKRRNMLEWLNMLVSVPDCFSRVWGVIFHCFTGLVCPRLTMAVQHVHYSLVLNYPHHSESEDDL